MDGKLNYRLFSNHIATLERIIIFIRFNRTLDDALPVRRDQISRFELRNCNSCRNLNPLDNSFKPISAVMISFESTLRHSLRYRHNTIRKEEFHEEWLLKVIEIPSVLKDGYSKKNTVLSVRTRRSMSTRCQLRNFDVIVGTKTTKRRFSCDQGTQVLVKKRTR